MVAQTYILIFLAIVAALAMLGWLFRPQLLRVKQYFVGWAERDKRAEEQARAEKAQRKQAEAELREKLVEDEPEAPVQKVKQ
ncbi:MAG: hypothetical protein QM758_25950 [Armatimonas sp.]